MKNKKKSPEELAEWEAAKAEVRERLKKAGFRFHEAKPGPLPEPFPMHLGECLRGCDCEFIPTDLSTIPPEDRWLYENPASLAALRAGFESARRGEVSEVPDLRRYADEDENDFRREIEEFASRYPIEFLNEIENGEVPDMDLPLYLEAVASIEPVNPYRVEEVVLPFLYDNRPHVREAAIYGLTYIPSELVLETLELLEQHDSSQAVRMAARNARDLFKRPRTSV